MMERCFVTVLNMSLAASVVILVVMAARVFLRKAPKYFSYALWGIVVFRLLCPISFSAGFSVYNLFDEVKVEQGRMAYFSYDGGSGLEAGTVGIAEKEAEESPTETANVWKGINPVENFAEDGVTWWNTSQASARLLKICTMIWLIGMLAFLAHSVILDYRLRKQLQNAVHETENIYRTNLTIPFVYGILSPKVYLPIGIEGAEKACILQHEQIHIKRGDYLIKMSASLVLWLHWFNPLVWLAFFACEKDMEMSCDEAVIRKLGGEVKKEYAASLLALSAGERFAGFVPAFGEGDVQGRIRNILHYKKPEKRIWGVALVLCLVLAMVLLTNPLMERKDEYAAAFTPPIKGISWGMTPEEVAKKLDIPEENISRGDLGQVQMVCENQTVFGQKGDVTLLFDMGRGDAGLLELWVNFEELDGEALKAKLVHEYGEQIADYPDKWGSERVEDLPQELLERVYYVKVEVPSIGVSVSFSKETIWNSLKSQPLVTVTLGETTLSYNAHNMAAYLMAQDEERYKELVNGITP